eukprot:COSAG02_NODE_3866_length_6121_cov_318.011956_3_plen_87_part_00
MPPHNAIALLLKLMDCLEVVRHANGMLEDTLKVTRDGTPFFAPAQIDAAHATCVRGVLGCRDRAPVRARQARVVDSVVLNLGTYAV